MKQQINQKKPDYSKYSVEEERASLRKFLDANELWVPENFYIDLRDGDVIDLYRNPPNISQLYANSQFKQLCSYSEEQMKAIPFPKLFYRADDIQLAFLKRLTDVAFNYDEAVSWNIEDHELVETMHPNKRTFEVNLGRVAPCFKKNTNERYGVIGSFRVNLIFEWNSK
jgi:hypothetical protein